MRDHHHHKIVPGKICEKDLCKIREAVCIQVEKIYDSCRERDCIEDARVLFWQKDINHIINKAINIKLKDCEVVDVYADIEQVPFKKGFYTVDVKYFIKVNVDFYVPSCRTGKIIPISRCGLVVFDKKVILFGSDGGVKIFKGHYSEGGLDKPIRTRLEQDNLPISKVEVAEPIGLNAKIEPIFDKHCDHNNLDNIPGNLLNELVDEDDEYDRENDDLGEDCKHHHKHKKVVVTLGIFSIVKLVRYVQLLIPAFDFCYPVKECISPTDEDPCQLFETIDFPFEEFYPPQKFDFPGALEAENRLYEEMRDFEGKTTTSDCCSD